MRRKCRSTRCADSRCAQPEPLALEPGAEGGAPAPGVRRIALGERCVSRFHTPPLPGSF
jgi:hypothetical protein